jgi:Ras-related protein Rab-7A
MRNILKIFVYGDSGVGKTSLINYFLYQKRERKTNFIELFIQKEIIMENKKYIVQFCDFSGQQKYPSIIDIFFRKTDGCICVLDVTDKESFITIVDFLEKYCEEEHKIIIVANKTDLEWKIVFADIVRLSRNYNKRVFFTNCINGENVNEAFYSIIRQINVNNIQYQNSDIVNLSDLTEKESKKCCCL